MKLDDDQEKIVNHRENHALVLAGAGAGKTHSIIQRAIKMIEEGFPADKILLLTFTNKACAEMRERIKQAECEVPLISTFHKFGSKLIREDPEIMGLRRNPSIMDAKDARARLQCNLKDMHVPRENMSYIASMISKVANEGLDPENKDDRPEILEILRNNGTSNQDDMNLLLNIFLLYGDLKRADNVLDYDDLICLPIRAFRRNELFRKSIQEQYWDLTIDESQDSNTAQYNLVKLINSRNICMIGDSKQALYTWRGARPSNLMLFKKDFDPQIYHLVRNYRSVPVIVNSASSLIKHNELTMEKDSYSVRQDAGNKIFYAAYDRDSEMAENVAIEIRKEIDKGLNPNGISVLYRMNRMAKTLEPAFLKHQIPYHIKKGTELLERAEVKMLIAAGRLLINPSDIQALTRISQLIQGFGPKGIKILAEASREGGNCIWGHLDLLKGKNKVSLERLQKSLDVLKTKGPGHLISWALEETSFKDWMRAEAQKSAKTYKETDLQKATRSILDAHVRNLKVFQAAVTARLENSAQMSLEDQWYEVIIDLILSPPDESDQEEAVTLSTVHSAKGLQWNQVHVVGFSDGLIPLRNSETHCIDNLTEERCIAYVAMTRAKDKLLLHHCRSSIVHGQFQDFGTSRFLQEFATDQVLECHHANR